MTATKTPIKCMIDDNERLDINPVEFAEKNNFKLIPQEQVIELMRKHTNVGFDFAPEVIMDFLEVDNLREFTRPDADLSDFKTVSFEEGVQDFLDYLVFAWGKALDERGISAGRSLQKLSAWLNLYGRSELSEILNDPSLYNPYGAPALLKVSRELGIEPPARFVEYAV